MAIRIYRHKAKENSMKILDAQAKLSIRQKKEWGEILSGFDFRNKYSIFDESGKEVLIAGETGGSITGWLARLFLKSMRPFTIEILDTDGKATLTIKRPFRFYYHSVDVLHPDGRIAGSVKREFSILRRKYTVKDAMGLPMYSLFGPILKPWTFFINENEKEAGKIVKNWSGALKEVFSAADNFGVEFPTSANAEKKAVLLGAVFLIDFMYFERHN
ncbi:MAG: phospholipid scramblase family protein [Deltaproteobacteria bacterium]|nr:phospholipid scramblase family protein [Deltaproteobacteria bacterium]